MGRIIYGGDTETVDGKPNSFQFYSEDTPCSDFFIVNEKNACKTFLAWCAKRKPDHEHVVYFHNLRFDLIELLYGAHHKLVQGGDEFKFSVGEWEISGVYGTPTFARIRNRNGRKVILLVDSLSFFKGTVGQAAELYCPGLPKLKAPKNLGKVRYGRTDYTFVAYAMRDPEIVYHIGRAVEELHHEFELKQCLSIADLAARIFRHWYLTYTIPQPSDDIIVASLDAYHGGKNTLAVAPGWYVGVSGLDISSAYPWAMSHMPAFQSARLYKHFRVARSVRSVPSYGVYEVSGTLAPCSWPVLFDHDFTPLSGDFENVHVQGFELNEALASGELKLRRVEGHYYDAERDNGAPALRAFVDDFYRRKSTEKNKVKRQGYKDVLNSLYGKFIQTRKRSMQSYVSIESGRMTEAHELVAGGMFHPFIAAAITAEPRAFIHQLEHKYKALHTATDGIFTLDARAPKSKANGLGSVGRDCAGDLLLIRNKLYIVYGEKSEDSIPSRAFKGKHIIKYAKHGFQGSVHDLERLVATNRRKYKATHVNQLKESLKRGLQVNRFEQQERTLKVGPLPVRAA